MSAAVLGAGVQGVLAALMLAQRGHDVTLIDQRREMMVGASLNYEGRVHLGLIYAMDRSFSTSARMAADALHFAPVVERLLRRRLDWATLSSTASRYLVHRQSHLSVEQLEDHFGQVEQAVLDGLRDDRLSYLGQRLTHVARRAKIPADVSPTEIVACFDTVETCVDQPALRKILTDAVAAMPRITLGLGLRVRGVSERAGGDWEIACEDRAGARYDLKASLVVNCLWEERARLDRQAGIDDFHAESLRLKYSLLVRRNKVIDRLGSFLIAHGAFGSIVTHPGQDYAFLSWYPASLKGIVPSQILPDEWRAACAGTIPSETMEQVWRENLAGFAQIIPGLGNPEPLLIKAGIILAEGLRDIDRPDSGFHRRDEWPIRQSGSFFSVATGKYTSAPRNAELLERAIFGE